MAPDSARALNRGLLEPGPALDRRIIYAFWQRYEGAGTQMADQRERRLLEANAQREEREATDAWWIW
ncbi:MAG: hypothetical protein U0527_12730 [Candidatus Eisenbacteria bacterium]